MSERKTTEIKLRVTPDEKTRWQVTADKQGISLSELIRDSMNGTPERVYEPRIELPTPSPIVAPTMLGACPCAADGSMRCPGGCGTSPQEVVGTTDEVGSVQSLPLKSWTYEARARG